MNNLYNINSGYLELIIGPMLKQQNNRTYNEKVKIWKR